MNASIGDVKKRCNISERLVIIFPDTAPYVAPHFRVVNETSIKFKTISLIHSIPNSLAITAVRKAIA